MPRYVLGNNARESIKVSRNSAFWITECFLPDELKDTMTSLEVAELNGLWFLRYYADPAVGDIVQHKGHEWQVVARVMRAEKRSSKHPSGIGVLRTKYLGSLQEEEDDG